MGVWETFRKAVRVYRENFVLFAAIVLIVEVPCTIYQGMLGWKFGHPLSGAIPNKAALMQALGLMIWTGPVWLAAYFLQWSALSLAVAARSAGRPVTLLDAYSRGSRFLWPNLVASLAAGLAAGLGFLLGVVPGCILMAGWSYMAPVIVLERSHGLDSLSRSWALSRGRKGRLFLFFCLMMLVNLSVTAIWKRLLPPSAVHADVVGDLITTIPAMLLGPLFAVLVTLDYFSARVEKEGFTLEALQRELG
jgi:hypothetical protein